MQSFVRRPPVWRTRRVTSRNTRGERLWKDGFVSVYRCFTAVCGKELGIMVHDILSEDEMRIVYEARAQSRREVADLERLKDQLLASYFKRQELTENEFNQHWPEICAGALRERACNRIGDPSALDR